MTSSLIRAAFARPGLALLLVLIAAGFGAISFGQLRRDVFPDLSAPVFNVIVQNAAMGAEELEAAVAIPLETALAGLPDVRRIRSIIAARREPGDRRVRTGRRLLPRAAARRRASRSGRPTAPARHRRSRSCRASRDGSTRSSSSRWRHRRAPST